MWWTWVQNIVIQGTQSASFCESSTRCLLRLCYSSNVWCMWCSIVVPLLINNYMIISDLEVQVRTCQINTKGLMKADRRKQQAALWRWITKAIRSDSWRLIVELKWIREGRCEGAVQKKTNIQWWLVLILKGRFDCFVCMNSRAAIGTGASRWRYRVQSSRSRFKMPLLWYPYRLICTTDFQNFKERIFRENWKHWQVQPVLVGWWGAAAIISKRAEANPAEASD